MANYSVLKSAIEAVIKTNGNNEITGALLQQSLISMITSLGAHYDFVDVATPSTNPGTPDQNVMYFAAMAGTYSNFGGIVVNDGEACFLCYNGTWTKKVSGAATAAQVTELAQDVSEIRSDVDGQNQEIADFEETITNQIDNFRPIVIEGNVVNAPDEEDITTDENDLLKFANRGTLHGMGYVILRRDKTFAEQVTLANTIYEIRYDFDLGGASVAIPSGSILKFNGGSIVNGTLTGALNQGYIDAKCFGFIYNNSGSATHNASCFSMIRSVVGVMLEFSGDVYLETTTTISMDSLVIKGNGNNIYAKGNNNHIFNVANDVKVEGLRIFGDVTSEQRLIYINAASVCDIIIRGCYVSGNLTLIDCRKIVDADLSSYIRLLSITDNIFEEINGVYSIYGGFNRIIQFDQTAIIQAELLRNSVHNFYGQFFSIQDGQNDATISTRLKAFYNKYGMRRVISDNNVANDIDYRPWTKFSGYAGYFCFAIVEFGDLLFENNTISNIIDKSNNYVYWLYGGAYDMLVRNNIITNCINLDNNENSNEILKAKSGSAGQKKRWINNTFTYTDLHDAFQDLTIDWTKTWVKIHHDTGNAYELMQVEGNVFDVYYLNGPSGNLWMAEDIYFIGNKFHVENSIRFSTLVGASSSVKNVLLCDNEIKVDTLVTDQLVPSPTSDVGLLLVSVRGGDTTIDIYNNRLHNCSIIYSSTNSIITNSVYAHDNIITCSLGASVSLRVNYQMLEYLRLYNNIFKLPGAMTLNGQIDNCIIHISNATTQTTALRELNRFISDGYYKIIFDGRDNATRKKILAEVNVKRDSGEYTFRAYNKNNALVTLTSYTDLKRYGDSDVNVGFSQNRLWAQSNDFTVVSLRTLNITQTDFDNDVFELGNTHGITAQRPVFAAGTHKGFNYFDETIGKMIVWNGSAWVNMDGSALA